MQKQHRLLSSCLVLSIALTVACRPKSVDWDEQDASPNEGNGKGIPGESTSRSSSDSSSADSSSDTSNADRTSGATHANSTGDASDSLYSPPTTPTTTPTTTRTNTTTSTTSKVPASLDALRKATDPVEKAQCLRTCWNEVSLKDTGAKAGKDAKNAAALWKIIVEAWWSNSVGYRGVLRENELLKEAIWDALTHAAKIAAKPEEAINDEDPDVKALEGLASKAEFPGYVTTLQTTNQGENVFDGTNGKGWRRNKKEKVQITQAQSTALAAYLEILAAYAATP
ncbi:MAG: hypothetical protein AAFQ08_00445 [Bacteroidota bacterium]